MRDQTTGGPVTQRIPTGAGPDARANGSGRDGPRPPGRPGLRRTLLALTALWTLFVLLNLTLSGHWWPWLVFSLVPPLAHTAGSLALLIVAAAVRRVRSRATVVLAVLALALACPQSGLVPSVLWYRAPHSGVPVRIVAWNTEYWDQNEDPAAFFTRLRALHADVYMLSEYLNYRDGEAVPINDRPRLDQAFPGYHVVVKGQLVTLSRLPVSSVPVTDDPDVLRVDVTPPGGARLSVYNVHVPAQLDPTASPLSATFWSTLRERARDRGHSYAALRASVLTDRGPGVIAGDFNTTASMGDLRRVTDLGQDAARAGRTPLPLSWNAHQAVQLWKLDWMFTRNGFAAADYRLAAPWGTSDHRVQILDARDPEASS
jgi:endonuclease/exonuclease/phosphatase (EEP) superfamily protein YafD